MSDTIVIPRQFRGPQASGNGGYTCGVVAEALGAAAVEVTLRVPPPLETPLRVERHGDGIRVLDGETLVAEARPEEPGLAPPPAPSFARVEAISAAHPPEADHPFPGCFVCGTGREPGDALCLRPAPLGGGLVAAPWRVEPQFAAARFVWAALDCPGGWSVQPDASRGISFLGRLTARVDEPPAAGDECVVLAWPLEALDARRTATGTALFRDGELLAVARAVWFAMGAEARDRAGAR